MFMLMFTQGKFRRRILRTYSMYTWSLHYPSFLVSFAKHIFSLGTFDTFWGHFMQTKPFVFQAGAGYIH